MTDPKEQVLDEPNQEAEELLEKIREQEEYLLEVFGFEQDINY